MRGEIVVNRFCIAVATLSLVVSSSSGVSGQQEGSSPSAAESAVPESTTAAPSRLAEQTCVDPDDQRMWELSASAKTVGDLLDCAQSLGLKEGDPEYDTYDFTLMKRTAAKERYTQQCDETGNHIGSHYRAWGSDTLYRADKPERAVSGTFDLSVVSTLNDPAADTWQVEKQGIIWEVHSPDGDLGWTWSVEMTAVSDGAPDMPQLDKYRDIERDAFEVFCEYLK